MKQQKQKKNFFKKRIKRILLIKVFLLGVFSTGIVFGFLQLLIPTQTATTKGSNNSEITFSTGGVIGDTYYINPGENTTIIGNYFKGYYYNNVFGAFELDWDSVNKKNNVRIVDSTSKCTTGYGYKLGGYAKSNYNGLIDFNYSKDIYVYYCELDKKLHGYAYSKHLGFQSFEGIGFEIIPTVIVIAEDKSSTGVFVNDTTDIDELKGKFLDTLKDTDESIFYIIK